jgi:four helix bundle protein
MITKKEFVLSKQLLRSGTSVGANIMEANGAISKADFSAKMSIAYEECLESKYWLSLLKDSGDLNIDDFNSLFEKAMK